MECITFDLPEIKIGLNVVKDASHFFQFLFQNSQIQHRVTDQKTLLFFSKEWLDIVEHHSYQHPSDKQKE